MEVDLESALNFIQQHKILFSAVLGAGVGFFLLKRYAAGGWCYSKNRLDGKTALITGANTGIGKETAIDFAKRGAKVIVACRDTEKGSKALQEIVAASGNNNVSIVKLDLASLESVRSCAEKVNAEESRLDILVNNAGIMTCPHWKTKDGFEMQIGTNHLGHFLFTNLLLDLVKKSAPSRIINVSSSAHYPGVIDFDDLHFERKPYSAIAAYCQSKIANVLFTKELARRLEGTSVTTYSLHPGAVQTELQRHLTDTYFILRILGMLSPLAYTFFKTPLQGAQTTIYCGVDDKAGTETGLYYSDCKPQNPAKLACDEEVARRLWEVSAELVGLDKKVE